MAADRSPSPAPACISTARPRPARAARWATSTGCWPRKPDREPADRRCFDRPRSHSGKGAPNPRRHASRRPFRARASSLPIVHNPHDTDAPLVQVLVRDNNVDQALKALKKKMQREGLFREMKLRNYYEKPSERRAREKAEAVRRARKLARKRAQREGPDRGGAARSADAPSNRRLSTVWLAGEAVARRPTRRDSAPAPGGTVLGPASTLIRSDDWMAARRVPRAHWLAPVARARGRHGSRRLPDPAARFHRDDDIDAAAVGSQVNIGSLTAVISAEPQRRRRLQRAGHAPTARPASSSEAIADFDTAIKLNPNFYQAYANRALVERRLKPRRPGARRLQHAPSRSTRTTTSPMSAAATSTARTASSISRSPISTAPSSSIPAIRAPITIAA